MTRVSDLEREEEEDDVTGVRAAVDVIAIPKIVDQVDVCREGGEGGEGVESISVRK